MIEQVVVTDAWVRHEGKVLLHPALQVYEQGLLRMSQQWGNALSYTPLSWYAEQAGVSPAAFAASLVDNLPDTWQQIWLASPYHARLTRTSLQVMPEHVLDWSPEVAQDVCERLNPLLAEDGLKLVHVQGLLLFLSERVWQVLPPSFAEIAGHSLPNQHMAGDDAGDWARLLSEMQMVLHQSPVKTAQGLDVHGLWLWGESKETPTVDVVSLPGVASKDVYLNIALQALDKQRDARVIVSHAESLPTLLPSVLPQDWLLLGAGKSVRLKNNMLISALAKVSKPKWKGI